MTQEVIDAARGGDEFARNAIIMESIPSLERLAKKYVKRFPNVSVGDLVGEAVFGVVEAINRFDASMGGKFSAYVNQWAFCYMMRGLQKLGYTVRFPHHVFDLLLSWDATKRRLVAEHGSYYVTEDLVAKAGGFDAKKVTFYRNLVKIIQPHDESLLQQIAASDPIREVDERDEWEHVERGLISLDKYEQEVVYRRFGMNGYEPHKYIDYRKHMGISESVAYSYVKKSLCKVRRTVGIDLETS